MTLEQKRKNRFYAGFTEQSSQIGPDIIRKEYQDAAKRLWRLGDNWEERLAYKLFGPDLIGSLAFALDPFSRFRQGFNLISQPTRSRRRPNKFVPIFCNVTGVGTHYRNYVSDDPSILDEYVVSTDIESYRIPDGSPDTSDYMHDSVKSQRAAGQEDYGLMDSVVQKCSTLHSPVITFTEDLYDPNNVFDGQYDHTHWEWTYDFSAYKSPCLQVPWGWVDSEDFAAIMKDFATFIAGAKAQDVLPKSLANQRQYNLFYQIAEFKDIPQLVAGTRDFLTFLGHLAMDPKFQILRADKLSSGAYLGWFFGEQSLLQTAQSLAALPTKISKKLNYLLKKIGKTEPIRSSRKYDDINSQAFLARFSLPDMVRVPYAESTNLQAIDLSSTTVSSSVIQKVIFPESATPYGSAKTLANFVGLTPRVTDLYNLVPWTWLLDWFVGLSNYINMIEAVNGDQQLINFGFLTVKCDIEFAVTGTITVYDAVLDARDGAEGEPYGAYLLTKSNPREIPASLFYHGTTVNRLDIGELGLVKAASRPDSLSDFQLSILGALFLSHLR
jgi:hypothetical protein